MFDSSARCGRVVQVGMIWPGWRFVLLEYIGDACRQNCLLGIAEIVCLVHSPLIRVGHAWVEKPVSPAQHVI